MLSRQESTKTKEEKVGNIKKGLQYAREAVDLDNKDGLSWAVLGNAHLSCFFGIEQNPKILADCLKAYSEAVGRMVCKRFVIKSKFFIEGERYSGEKYSRSALQ